MSVSNAELSWFQDSDELVRGLRDGRVRATSTPDLDDYDELRFLGRGGQGDVFTGVHQRLGRRVAIKVLRDGLWRSDESQRRFDREIELVAKLQHPHIVRIYESGLTRDDRRFYAMEYIEGLPLGEFLRQNGRNPQYRSARGRVALFSRICDAVSFAHQNGIIHRDLKPSNILVDARGFPHLLDFGLATWMVDSQAVASAIMTITGQFVGTLCYAAPEQIERQRGGVDVRTDVYAMGVVLYEMLAGTLPFGAEQPIADVIRAISGQQPAPPSRADTGQGSFGAATDIDRDLDAIVLKALEKDKGDRYETAAALRADVERHLAGDAVDARRRSGWYVLTKALWRHRFAAGVAAAVLTALVGFAVMMSVLYRRLSVEAEKTRQIRVFLEDTLGSVSPRRAGESVTMADALDEAVHWVNLSLSGQPEAAASIRTTIGNSFRSLGQFDKADEQLELALARRREMLGDDHAETAQSLNALALLRRDQGRLDEADALLREALRIRVNQFGQESLPVAQCMQNLASVQAAKGNLDAAWELIQRAFHARQAILGADHPDSAMCGFQLAELARRRGELAVALQVHEDVLRIREQILHPEHPDIARSLLAVGRIQLESNRPRQAWPPLKKGYDQLLANLGCSHHRAIEALKDLKKAAVDAPQRASFQRLLDEHLDCLDRAAAPPDLRNQLELLQAAQH